MKISVLFIQDRLVCGGAEQALYDLLSMMDRDRFEITVLALYRGGEWYEKFCDLGIQVITPWSCQKYSPNPFRKLWNKYIGLWILDSMNHNGRKLVPRCTFRKFDVIVSYGVWHLPESGFAGKAKTVKMIHGDMQTNENFRKNILKDLQVLPRFDRIICVSRAAEASFRKWTGIEKNVTCLYNPIDSERVFRMAQEPVDFRAERPLVCAVGRLHREKGFERLIRIHRRLLDAGASHDLVIVGDGEERDSLENLIRELGVQNSVTLAGYQANPYPYIRMSRLLVCSSYTEGLPVVSAEALVLGIPIVSSVPSVGEAFDGENCGILTDNDDKSLQQGLYQMLTDQTLYAEQKAGAERRSRMLAGRAMTEKVEKELLSLVQQTEKS